MLTLPRVECDVDKKREQLEHEKPNLMKLQNAAQVFYQIIDSIHYFLSATPNTTKFLKFGDEKPVQQSVCHLSQRNSERMPKQILDPSS